MSSFLAPNVEQEPSTDARPPPAVDMETTMSIVIFGATGDLARKKLYPALYQLMFGCPDAPLLPTTARIVGYGRNETKLPDFLEKQCVNVKGEHRTKFFGQCYYFAGAYDQEASFAQLDEYLKGIEGGSKANRIFFCSVPPVVFGDLTRNVHSKARAPGGGHTRLILEKPFGRDSRSFGELNALTSSLFSEDELFRIDHYLGKEVVLNMVTLRFGNQFFEGIWSREHIANVQIVFKEDLGTGGRGGYFDNFGIIRDIMQNHLLQVFEWFAMEPPSALQREQIAAEKCKLLRAVRTVSMEDCFLGQFGKNHWDVLGTRHDEPGYLDDPTVPPGSKCPTYAAVVLRVDNDRWRDVPFLMRAGKGLDERMSEVRVTFKTKAFNKLVPGSANELVMRIQPDEAIYLKYMNKYPGWEKDRAAPAVLDMTYGRSFSEVYLADAYERMFLNTAKGDGSLFVGSGELVESWRIFTPLLDEIDKTKPPPVLYPFGVRVPPGMDDFARRYGITMAESWEEDLAVSGKSIEGIKAEFEKLDRDGNGFIDCSELKQLAQQHYDGRAPPDKVVGRILERLDTNGDGRLDFDEVKRGIHKLSSHCKSDCEFSDWDTA